MPLSWNEIKSRAITFAKEWENESSEDAEAKSFWDSFFDVFGISRRRVATFEAPVKKADAKQGFIDLLWTYPVHMCINAPGSQDEFLTSNDIGCGAYNHRRIDPIHHIRIPCNQLTITFDKK